MDCQASFENSADDGSEFAQTAGMSIHTARAADLIHRFFPLLENITQIPVEMVDWAIAVAKPILSTRVDGTGKIHLCLLDGLKSGKTAR